MMNIFFDAYRKGKPKTKGGGAGPKKYQKYQEKYQGIIDPNTMGMIKRWTV